MLTLSGFIICSRYLEWAGCSTRNLIWALCCYFKNFLNQSRVDEWYCVLYVYNTVTHNFEAYTLLTVCYNVIYIFCIVQYNFVVILYKIVYLKLLMSVIPTLVSCWKLKLSSWLSRYLQRIKSPTVT